MNRMLKLVLSPARRLYCVIGCILMIGTSPVWSQDQGREPDNPEIAMPSFAGTTYQMPDARIDGNPWLFPVYSTGSLSWMGRSVDSEYLRYDLILDQLILLTSSGRQEYLIALSPLHVPVFTLAGRRFRGPDSEWDEAYPDVLQSGYHELVFQGESLELLCVHSKKLLSESRSMSIEYYFDYKRSLFLLHEGEIVRILTNRQLLKALGAHKKELKRMIRERGLSVKKSELAELVPLLELFEQLSRQS